MVHIKTPSGNWLDEHTKADEMKTLGATELSVLRRFVRDVLATIDADDTGVTDDLVDGADASAEILGIIVARDDIAEYEAEAEYYVKSDDEEG